MTTGDVALVTGAGTGIGRASAVALARSGNVVVGVGRRLAPLEALSLEEAGLSVHAVAESLDSAEGCGRAVAAAVAAAGAPLVLVHAAGLGGFMDRPIFEETTEAWRATMAVNLDAAFELIRLTAPAMRSAGRGRIILIGSTAGSVGAPSMSAYSASKAGLVGLMRSVACDVAPFGITCNAVLPTWVRGTEMAEADAQLEASARFLSVEEIWRERAAAAPAGRVLDAEEVAHVVTWLAGDDSSGVNGAAIDVTLGAVW